MEIVNVYCVGRNYRQHAAELGNAVPTSPMLFLKPSHAAVSLKSGVLRIPGGQGEVHYETELVLRVGRPYREGIAPDELFSHVTVGLDLTLRSLQSELKAKGLPWLPAKGFRNSAPLGEWREYPGQAVLAGMDFGLRLNGQQVQQGNIRDMVFGLAELAAFAGRAYGLGPGDLLFTGTPEGVGALSHGDELEWRLGGEVLGRAKVSMEA